MIDHTKVSNVVIGGIDFTDYPECSDQFIESADYEGIPMEEDQLEELNNSDYDYNLFEHLMDNYSGL